MAISPTLHPMSRLMFIQLTLCFTQNFFPQSQSIRSRTTTTTSLASSEYVPLPDVLAGQELEECWEESEEEKSEDEKDKHEYR